MCIKNMTMSALLHDVQQTVTGQFVVKQKPIHLEETKAVRAAVEEAVQLGEGEG